jgi:transforming growth factor-beta-induced protein
MNTNKAATRGMWMMALVALALIVGSVNIAAHEATVPSADIVDVAFGQGALYYLVEALEAAELAGALRGEGPFTVFAPLDEAFLALPAGTLSTLLADPTGDLTQILLYHVVPGRLAQEEIVEGQVLETLQGGSVTLSDAHGLLTVNGAVVRAVIPAENGVIYMIDRVLLPSESPLVLLDIVDTAVAAGSFNTLATALAAAELIDALKGVGPFTVFAPTDEAFAALPEGTVEALLADPTGDLTKILLYHVLSGEVLAEAVADGLTVETLQGGTVTFSIVDGAPRINESKIVATDIIASNGVIHVIDAVLLPEGE